MNTSDEGEVVQQYEVIVQLFAAEFVNSGHFREQKWLVGSLEHGWIGKQERSWRAVVTVPKGSETEEDFYLQQAKEWNSRAGE